MGTLQRREDLVLPSVLVREQTHPLSRGGTDLIAFEPSLSCNTLMDQYDLIVSNFAVSRFPSYSF
jgi:hypothetical protein